MDSNLLTKGVLALAAGAMMTLAVAQGANAADHVRVRGTIESVDGNTVMVKSRDGASLKLVLKDNANIRGVVKASLADVKAMVGMLIQTDRFGTSIAQSLRTHAETSRAKRRSCSRPPEIVSNAYSAPALLTAWSFSQISSGVP